MLKHLVAETCPDWFVELLNWTSQERRLSAESTLDTYFHNGRLTDLTGVTYFHGCENLFGKIGFAHPLLDEVTQCPGAVLSFSDHPKSGNYCHAQVSRSYFLGTLASVFG